MEVEKALQYCRIFISIGTSGTVYPAAGYVDEVQKNCARTIEVNLEPSEISHHFDEHYYGLASQTVPQLIDDLIKDQKLINRMDVYTEKLAEFKKEYDGIISELYSELKELLLSKQGALLHKEGFS